MRHKYAVWEIPGWRAGEWIVKVRIFIVKMRALFFCRKGGNGVHDTGTGPESGGGYVRGGMESGKMDFNKNQERRF